MGKRLLFCDKDNQMLMAYVYMKSDYLGWDKVKYADGRSHIDDIKEDAPNNIDIIFSPEEKSVYISSEKGSEAFWIGYRNLIDQYFRIMHHPIPSDNRKRKVISKKYFKAGDKTIIDNWFIEIVIHFFADCKVEHTPIKAPYFSYVFNFI